MTILSVVFRKLTREQVDSLLAMTKNLTVIDHPLVQHKLTLRREKDTSTAVYRQLLREISTLLAYEVLRNIQIPLAELACIGIEVHSCDVSMRGTRDLVRLIDQEHYARSLAHYEHNFKIAAQ